MHDAFVIANYVEASLWAVMGLGLMAAGLSGRFWFIGWRFIRLRSGQRRAMIVGLALVAFGVSDLVETRTGAWWRPWWLLAWKAACLAVVLIGSIGKLNRTRSQQEPPSADRM